jgi:hypothetical protein
MGSDVTDQLLIRFLNRQTLEKKWEYNDAKHQSFIDFKKVYNSVRSEILYNILIELMESVKIYSLKCVLKETYCKLSTEFEIFRHSFSMLY